MEEFDWVTERQKCSLVSVFESLKMQLKQDVAIRQNQLHPGYGFCFDEGHSYAVVRLEGDKNATVRFEVGRSIVCTYDGTQVFTAAPTLSDDGKCRLKVNGKELDLWQISKLALEDMFFNI